MIQKLGKKFMVKNPDTQGVTSFHDNLEDAQAKHRANQMAKKISAPAGKLTADERKKLPTSSFAIPAKRAYPIHDENHARDALARVAANGTPEEKKMVYAAVAKRYPGIKQKHG